MSKKLSKQQKLLAKEIKRFVKSHANKTFTKKQLTKRFVHQGEKKELYAIIDHLIDKNRLQYASGDRVTYNKNRSKNVVDQVRGKVDMAPSGVAYILVDGFDDDVRVEKKNTNKALDGDTVLVGLFKTKKGNRPKGVIEEIIERAQEYYIGQVELSRDFAFVVPDNRTMPADFFINKKYINNAKNGDKVIVKMLGWPSGNKNPDGKIVEILGQSGSHDVEMKSILVESNFPLEFTQGVQKELNKISADIPEEEIAERKDMRDTLTFTIDPVDAKDFDDAISFQDMGDGTYEVGVHIADVTHYVQPGTALDANGYRRATSVYLVDRVLPMLPEKLSNIICSLRPDEESLCYSVIFRMDAHGNMKEFNIQKTVIHSDRRFTYDEALQEIEKGEGTFGHALGILNKMAQQIKKERFNNGSINFDSKELRFSLDDEDQITAVEAKQRHEAHFLIEEFMLLTNKTVAKFISDKKLGNQPYPFVYRIHDEPDSEKLLTFAMNAADFGHTIHTDNMQRLPYELNRFFQEIKGSPEQNSLESLAIRSMAKAVYDTDNIGHYGLGFEYYSHFTSPIRRYPDMMVHRQLHHYLTKQTTWEKKGELQERCEHCSDMERKAIEAERESVKYFQTVYMEDKIGEQFSGIVTGVTSWGFFVEISDVYTEGLVRTSDLSDDDYVFDEKKKQIVGRHKGRVFKLGSKVNVIVDRVDVEKRQIDLSYIPE